MTCKNVDFTVNEREYKIMEWPPVKTLELKVRLLKQMGAISFSQNDFSMDLQKLDPKEFVFFAKELTKDVMSVELKKKLDFDDYFSEYPEDLYKIMVEVMRIQFSRFFGKKGLSLLTQKVKSNFQKNLR
jgi:hypothetical protein